MDKGWLQVKVNVKFRVRVSLWIRGDSKLKVGWL